MYAVVEDGVIVNSGSLATLFPNVSFPSSGPEAEWLVDNGVYEVISDVPFDPATQRLENVEPYLDVENVYSVRVVPRSAEDLANERHNDITRAIQAGDMSVVATMTEAEKAEYSELAWRVAREQRNKRLSDCDWTQLPDAPLSNIETQDWATYRQALRDITEQSDPFNITWPTKPGV